MNLDRFLEIESKAALTRRGILVFTAYLLYLTVEWSFKMGAIFITKITTLNGDFGLAAAGFATLVGAVNGPAIWLMKTVFRQYIDSKEDPGATERSLLS